MYSFVFSSNNRTRQLFNLLCDHNSTHLSRANFEPFLKILLEEHVGLKFLEAHEAFKVKYCPYLTSSLRYHPYILQP